MNRLIHDNLTKTEVVIVQTIINMGDEIKNRSIDELAKEARVSPSMIVKFSKKLGFSGFKDLKYYVVNNRPKTGVKENDYIKFQAQKSNEFFEYITANEELIDKLAVAIRKSNYTVIYGQGPSLGVANYFCSKLSVASGVPVVVQSDEQMMDIEISQKRDARLIVLLSASLETKQITDKIAKLKARGDNYIVIYENGNYQVGYEHAVKLTDVDYEYEYDNIRDRTLFFLYLELVVNQLAQGKR